MYAKILAVATPHTKWETGHIGSEDDHCHVYCECGEELSASASIVYECPKCGCGYITEFVCYRIPADKMEEIGAKSPALTNDAKFMLY